VHLQPANHQHRHTVTHRWSKLKQDELEVDQRSV